MVSPKEQWQELQEQNLQLLKLQQETYLAAIKAWRAQFAAATEQASSSGAPQMPSFPGATGSAPTFGQNPAVQPDGFPAFPTPEEITEINRTYMERIAEQQQDFMRRLTALSAQT